MWLVKLASIILLVLSETHSKPTLISKSDEPIASLVNLEDLTYRLPQTSIPNSYSIELTTNVHNGGDRAISGVVDIDIFVIEDTNFLVLNSDRLDIIEAQLLDSNHDLYVDQPTVEVDAEKQLLVLSFENNLPILTQFHIKITFNGQLETFGQGFYRTSYVQNGVTKWLASTQFQATYARQSFPCYDEPQLKATFKLSIIHDESYEAISNADGVRSPGPVAGTIRTTFGESPKMSSYLLAFVVSDLVHVSNEQTKRPEQVLQRIFVRSGEEDKTKYALDMSVKLLEELENYTGTKYDLPKLDSAAVPGKGGAMENWALILYRENALIVEEDNAPHRTLISAYTVIAHELAHQFFGNLVTCDWWSQIWLNEGFATFFEYQLSHTVRPEYRLSDLFGVHTLQRAFKTDSLDTTRPMTFDAETPTEISNLFDNIAYSKSGSVLRMFQHIVGHTTFQNALKYYLEKNQYDFVTSDHLMEAFETQSIVFPFSRAFRTWENQKGYPVIHITDNGNSLTVSQKRYVDVPLNGNEDAKWYIPITWTQATDSNFETTTTNLFLPDDVDSININLPVAELYNPDQHWYIFNIQQTGYYRVSYEKSNWDKLAAALHSTDFESIHVLNRAQLIDDSMEFARTDRLDYETAMNILTYLRHETDYVPWQAASSYLLSMNRFLSGSSIHHKNFMNTLKIMSNKIYDKLGTKEVAEEPFLDRYAREHAINWACRGGNEKCLVDTLEEVHVVVEHDGVVPVGLQPIIYCNGLKGVGKQPEWIGMWHKMRNSVDANERLRIIDALGCTSDPILLEDYLDTLLGGTNEVNYSQAERIRALQSVYQNSPVGVTATIKFINGFRSEFASRFAPNAFNTHIPAMAAQVYNQEVANELRVLILDLVDTLSLEAVQSVSDNLMNNLEWLESPKVKTISWYSEEFFRQFDENEAQQHRLPQTSAPIHYKLELTTDVHVGTLGFSGTVEIRVILTANTDTIVLHSQNLNITSLEVFDEQGRILFISYELDATKNFLIIHLDEFRYINSEFDVIIDYTGNLLTNSQGCHRSAYGTEPTKYLLATQFQPSHARRCFPNYDEPLYKATFDVAITHNQQYNALGNMPGIRGDGRLSGTTRTAFETSPLMSSYLVAFVVSDFESTTNEFTKWDNMTDQAFFVRPGDSEKATETSFSSSVIFYVMGQYVRTEYDLPKLDSVDIPGKTGSMENWGLVQYREGTLTVEENKSPHRLVASQYRLLAHELAHMYFGNLVTCSSWDYTWLNEGFATLFQYHIPGYLRPFMRAIDFFNVQVMQSVFRTDSLDTTRSMSRRAETLAEVGQSFDSISYSKAGSVLRMMLHSVGDEVFRDIMELYLHTNAYKSVTPEDLMDAFETIYAKYAIDVPITRLFKTWETQKGYPVVNVAHSDNTFHLTQKRFVDVPLNGNEDASWYIPLNFVTAANPDFYSARATHYFEDGLAVKHISTLPELGFEAYKDWYLFNIHQTGYYRVNYDKTNWHNLANILNTLSFTDIETPNRAQLVDDSLTLARAGQLDFPSALRILTYLTNEIEYVPWESANTHLLYLNKILSGSPKYPIFQKFLEILSKKIYTRFGTKEVLGPVAEPNESLLDRFAREHAINWACRGGNEKCLADTLEEVHVVVEHDGVVPEGLQAIIYCNGLKGVDKQPEWIGMWHKMRNSVDANERLRIIDALGCTSDPILLEDYLDTLLGGTNEVNYSQAERIRALQSVYQNSPVGVTATIKFINGFTAEFASRFGQNAFDTHITAMAAQVYNQAQRDEFNNFLVTALSRFTSPNTLSNIISTMEQNRLLLDHENTDIILTFAEEYVSENSQELYRLPKTSSPIYYNLELATDVHDGTLGFSGHIDIRVVLNENTDNIVLHSQNLDILSVVVNDMFERTVTGTSFVLDEEYSFVIIRFDEIKLYESEFNIYIEFTGNLTTAVQGFYRTSYGTGANIKYLAATQFQPSHARKCFPHYDEPEYKATFDVTIIHDSSYHAVGNMPVIQSDELLDGTTRTAFATSPIMSSYLVAFVVSDFDSVSNEASKTPDQVLQTIYVRPGDVPRTDFSMAMSQEVLHQLEEFVSIKYDLPKLDSVDVPGKPNSMENWGLVQYQDGFMTVEEDKTPHRFLTGSFRLIAHELAHMFFGNLVTCEWWDYTWLNEGFATLLEYHISDSIRPEWRISDLFNVHVLQGVFRSDSLDSTRSMSRRSQSLVEVGQSFDSISYQKAGSVLRMLRHFVGDDLFKESLNLYLTTNTHKSVTPEHLMDAFEFTLNKHGITLPVAQFFKSWETQKGYPVIAVSHNNQAFHISQKRYVDVPTNENEEGSWHIPLNYVTAVDPDFYKTSYTDHLPSGYESLDISTSVPNFDPNKHWYIFNVQQTGYYRVNYEKSNWHNLASFLNTQNYGEIHVLNRAQLIDDSLTFARFGSLDFEDALNILTYLIHENDYVPWQSANTHLLALNRYLVGSSQYDSFKSFLGVLSEEIYDKLGTKEIPDEPMLDRFAREHAINWACRGGNEKCLADTLEEVHVVVEHDGIVPEGLQAIIYCNGLKGVGKQPEWIGMWHKMRLSTNNAERLRIIDALGCTSDAQILEDALDAILGNTGEVALSGAERTRLLQSIYQNSPIGVSQVIKWMKSFRPEFTSRFGAIDSHVLAMASQIYSQEQRNEFFSFVSDMIAFFANTNTVQNIIATIDRNAASVNHPTTEVILKFAGDFVRKIKNEDSIYRLPRTSKPLSYKVEITTNVHTGATLINGVTDIHTVLTDYTDSIVLHYRRLNIVSIEVRDMTSFVIPTTFEVDPVKEHLKIYFETYHYSNEEFNIHVVYNHDLPTTGSQGFYRTSYVVDGVTRYLAATQFESTNARTSFPCYDEPEYKATFELSIIHDQSYNAVANTPGTVTAGPVVGTSRTTFAITPVMSTYLNAYAISDFVYSSNEATKTPDQVLQRIFVRPGEQDKTAFALESSEKLLHELEDYVSISYDLEKLDSIAVPGKGGAMENWGLITYFENALIIEEDKAPHRALISSFTVIAHELAHQFFGNLVTCEWWSQIWLNEGFATLFEFQLSQSVRPQWRVSDLFNINVVHRVFKTDSLDTTRPMTHNGETPAEISALFDNIAYPKSGSVLRMFQQMVGDVVFREALHVYLARNQYEPVTSDDLLEAFEDTLNRHVVTNFDFTRAFRTWENQKGYPVINVAHSNNAFQITQKRYVDVPLNDNEDGSWYIPLNFAVQSNPDFSSTSASDFFENGVTTKQISTSSQQNFNAAQHWFVFNIQQTGYYRVNYEKSNWEKLAQTLNSNSFNTIHILNRAQLIDDSFDLARTGQLDYPSALGIFTYLRRDLDHVPWQAASNNLLALNRYLSSSVEYYKFQSLLNLISEPLFEKLGTKEIQGEHLLDRFARENAINWACRGGNEKCLAGTLEEVHVVVEHDGIVPEGLQAIIYCNGLKGVGKQPEWIGMWHKMRNSVDANERLRIIDALGCTSDPILLEDYLDTLLGGTNEVNYSQAERIRALQSVYQNSPVGVTATIKFINGFTAEFASRFGQNVFETHIPAMAAQVYNQAQRDEFNNFLVNYLSRFTSPNTLSNIISTMERNRLLLDHANTKIIVDFSENYVLNFVPSTTEEPSTTEVPSITSTSSPSTGSSSTSSSTTPAPGTDPSSTTTQTIQTTTDSGNNLVISMTLLLAALIATFMNYV